MLHSRARLRFLSRLRPCQLPHSLYRRGPLNVLMSTTSMPGEGRIEYEWIDGVERLDMYEPGGYHPVKINDVLYSRYRIVDKLGFGGYSTIWLARDESMERYVAIKVNISSSSQAVPLRETSVLRALSRLRSSTNTLSAGHLEHKFTPEILDEFIIEGPNGLHPCYTVSPAQGNLREASFSRLFPIQVARRLAGNLAQAVSLVHSRGFVHGDIHLRNVLVRTESNFDELSIDEFRERFGEPEAIPVRRIDGKPLTPNVPAEAVLSLCLGKKAQDFTIADADGLILSDFGETFNPSMEERLGRHCNTPVSKRAPEALMVPDSPLSFPSDIWSLGLAIWEIVGMKPLFGDCETEDEIVAQQVDVIGDQHFPQSWREHWERQGEEKQDDLPQSNAHWPTCDREKWPPLDEAFNEFVQRYREKRAALGMFSQDETDVFLELMRGMLKFRPDERFSIQEVLESKWMKEWVMPERENSR